MTKRNAPAKLCTFFEDELDVIEYLLNKEILSLEAHLKTQPVTIEDKPSFTGAIDYYVKLLEKVRKM